MPRTTGNLVSQYLERVSSVFFEKYQKLIKEQARGRHGIYALYKGDKLYYVGLASNLPARVNAHLKDKHKGRWNRFSLYLTIGSKQIRELESLVLRIVRPTGNTVSGRLAHAENLAPKLQRQIRQAHAEELASLFGLKRRRHPKRATERRPTIFLRAAYKGKTYRARLRPDNTVRYAGKVYSSSSAAARAIVGRAASGPGFWQYERAPGDWVRLGMMTGGSQRKR